MHAPTERRAAERFPINGDTSCSFLSPVTENFGAARVQNISMDGIGLLTARRVEEGALLAVTLTNPARNFVKTVMVRVVHVTPQLGSFLVGGTLDPPLAYNDLTALVM